MTRWKEQIDRELGSEPKFNLATKEKIMQKVAAHEPNRDWRAAMAITGILFIAVLLVLSSSYQPEQQMQLSKSLEQVLEESEVKEFFISGLRFNEEKFIAKDSEFYIGNEKYDKQEDVQFIQSLLKRVSVYEGDEFSDGKDVLINMKNGEQLKLKLYPFDSLSSIGIKDMKTGLFYTAASDDVSKFYFDYQPRVNTVVSFILVFLLAGLNLFVERSLLKRNNLQKKRKIFLNKWHLIIMVILTVSILFIGRATLLTGSMAVHKGSFLAVGLLILSVNYAFQRKYELNQIYRKIDLFHYLSTAGITALIVFWL
jgi:hypothetical protein